MNEKKIVGMLEGVSSTPLRILSTKVDCGWNIPAGEGQNGREGEGLLLLLTYLLTPWSRVLLEKLTSKLCR